MHGRMPCADPICHANEMGFYCLWRDPFCLRHRFVHFWHCGYLHPRKGYPPGLRFFGRTSFQCLSGLRYPTDAWW